MVTRRLTKTSELPNPPDIPGLQFRAFAGAQDYPKMLAVILGSKDTDGLVRSDTLEDIERNYAHLVNSDPEQDMVFVQVDGEVVGYTRVEWAIRDEDQWIGTQTGFLLPAWRRRGIGTALLSHNENRLRAIANRLEVKGVLKPGQPRFFDTVIFDTETAKAHLFSQHGYRIARQEYEMVRPDLNDIPEAPLPPGLEVRPALPEHYRPIWDAMAEAFRDHWGYAPPTEEEYHSWLEDRIFQPQLWKIAWDGDQVAGMVQSFINTEENQEYQRQRGYTEDICVRRPWRRRGLARALLVQSLHMLKACGMEAAALTVDTHNWSGALRLYESVGFMPVKYYSIYRKPLGE
jgi:mycothiol synthase